jgi:ATP-binding cassette subfamily C (CFTR/MRP) protein 1
MQLANLMQIVVLWTYFGIGGVFSPAIIFPAIQLFSLIQSPLSSLPNAVSSGIQTRTALRRIHEFMNEPDLEKHPEDQRFVHIENPQENEVLIDIKDGNFAWRESTEQESKRAPFVLQGINCQLKRGEFVAVVAKLGGGKTSFLKAILGEMSKQQGRIIQRGTVAFAQQDAFILNGTLRSNICFGLEFDENRYYQVIDQSALTADLPQFKGGDLVEIGERGINLSGGQMARLSLARALYSRADVVLLDDPLSAVGKFLSFRGVVLCANVVANMAFEH